MTARFALPSIYPITDTRTSGLSHVEQVRQLTEGGATLIQVREKEAASGEFFEAAREAVRYAHERGVKIIINDRVDIAIAAGADGVHLGQDDLPPDEARKLLGPDAIIGFSTHSAEQARTALDLPVDYIAIGPIFATSTKPDPDPVVGLAGLREVRLVTSGFPLVAIGGIDAENGAKTLANGADSLAVISSVLSEPGKITERIRAMLGLAGETTDIAADG